MTVGKPDFNLNSFGIQYKEKRVNYTNKRAGINTSSTTQTELEQMSENKVMNSFKPSGKTPVDQAKVVKPSKYGKQEKTDEVRPATSTTPTLNHEESVFDNVPYTKDEMVTQEGGSTYKKKDPRMPNLKPSGRAGMESTMRLSESKENPIKPTNNPQDKTSRTPESTNYETPKKIADTPKGEKSPDYVPIPHKGISNKKPDGKPIIKAKEIIMAMNIMKLDLMEITKFGKEAGAERVDPDEMPQKEAHYDLGGGRSANGQHTVKPKAVGTSVRRMIDGVMQKVPNEVKIEGKGNKKRSLRGDMQMSKELENKTPEEIKDKFDMITNSPKYQESIHRDAPLTEKEGTDKFDKADPKTQAILARIAARNAKKKSIDEINAMTDGMKELMKESTDEEKKDFAIRERNYESLGAGGGKPDNSLLLDIEKPTVKKIKKDAEETVFKAISLKLDLMKVSTFKPNKKVTHLEELQDRAEQIEIHDMDKKIKEDQDDKKDSIMINKP